MTRWVCQMEVSGDTAIEYGSQDVNNTTLLNDKWRQLFDKFDPEGFGEIPWDDFLKALQSAEFMEAIPASKRDMLAQKAEQRTTSAITFQDFVNVMSGKRRRSFKCAVHHLDREVSSENDFHIILKEPPIFDRMVQIIADEFLTEERDRKYYADHYTCCPPPLFILFITLVELGFFTYYTVATGEMNAAGPVPIDSVFIYRPDKRLEVWRFFFYMVLHAGWLHLLFNLLVQLLVGLPLEMVHGSLRIGTVYMAGVLAGSLGTSVFDADVYLVGASGGVYALLAAHLANVLLVAYNGLAEKYVLGKRRCTRPPPNLYRPSPRDCEDEKKLKAFEQALDNLIKRLDVEEELANLLLEGKKKKSQEVVPKSEYPTKYLDRCASNYDWNYVNYYANDDITSPSGVSLRSVSSYYVLPGYPELGEPVRTDEESPPLPCEYDFIHMPRNQKGKFIRKTLPPNKKERFQAEIAYLLNQFENYKKKRREMGCGGSFLPRLGVKDLLLIDKINMGYVPDLEDRADLISLFEKIRPKEELKDKIDSTSREEVCIDYVPPKRLKYYRPNNQRQLAVLKRYTPRDHEDLDVIDRRRRGLRKLARINKGYFGSGPTLWKCKPGEDAWNTEGELDERKCTEEPCICPMKREDEINKMKKEISHPTFLAITVTEKELLKDSWKNRGINKSTLAMMWFTKLFKASAEELTELNRGQVVEELFMDEANFDYVDKLADIFDVVIKNLHRSTLCTKLIWEIGMYHCCLDLKEGYFELMKETLLDTLKENMQPPLTSELIEAWKKFIGIMFDIVHETFLLNSWPFPEKIGLKKKRDIEKDFWTSDACSEDYLLYQPSLAEEMDIEGFECDDQYGICGQVQTEGWEQLYFLDEDEVFEQDLDILELQTDEETLVN